MAKKFIRRTGALALGALLCVPVALGVMTGCKAKVAQSTVKDSAPVSYTALSEVTVTDGYAVNALDKELAYLLDTLNADKLLYWFYRNAKLTPKAAAGYGGGWESALIGGHTLGHYLSALAQAYANPGTPAARKAELKERIDYIVGELKTCQDNAGNAGAQAGFLWGSSMISTTNPEIQFDNVEANRTDIVTQAWVPWYTMHKILAGLIDLANLADHEQAKTVAIALGDWTYNRASNWSESTKNTVLGIEYGGMNDALYNLYALTGDERYADAAHKFDEITLFNKIIQEANNYLDGLHANTTIPKIIGALNRYMQLGEEEGNRPDYYLEVAEKFWEYVTEHHTYVTGGNSEWEHFGHEDVLDAERTNANCETCNTYNMLKLSRMLFTLTKDKKYLDYYENTYYNAIWSSQNPETGMTTYFQPMASGYFKVYSSPESHFWCCTGSGMESFTKLGDSIYYTAGNATYVSLYLSSTYKTGGLELEQTADLENSDTAKIKVKAGSTVLRLRRPYWSPEFSVTVNGGNVVTEGKEKFISVDVKKGDEIVINMRKTVRAYDLIDNPSVYAFEYGPFVLSAELGDESMITTTTGVNVTIPMEPVKVKSAKVSAGTEGGSAENFVKNIDKYMLKGADGKFTLTGTSCSYKFSYHFRQYRQRYAIYLPVLDSDAVEMPDIYSWKTVDTVQPGYGQYENDAKHNMQGGENSTGATNVAGVGTTRKAKAGGSFTYRMEVDKNAKNRLVVTFLGEDKGKTILIKSGTTTLYSATLSQDASAYSVNIDIPQAVLNAAVETEWSDASGNHSAPLIPITISGVGGVESARVCGYIYTQKLAFDQTAADTLRDSSIAYYVNCGDPDPYTLNAGEKLGMYNSATEQVYGADVGTGKKWGIVDNGTKTWGEGTSFAGHIPTGGVATNGTWALEGVQDGADKTASMRYTKNAWELGLARKLCYKFELPNGNYTVKMYFMDIWNCTKNPNVKANGESKITNGALSQELSFSALVSGGELTLDITTEDMCLALCYIIIEFA